MLVPMSTHLLPFALHIYSGDNSGIATIHTSFGNVVWIHFLGQYDQSGLSGFTDFLKYLFKLQ